MAGIFVGGMGLPGPGQRSIPAREGEEGSAGQCLPGGRMDHGCGLEGHDKRDCTQAISRR